MAVMSPALMALAALAVWAGPVRRSTAPRSRARTRGPADDAQVHFCSARPGWHAYWRNPGFRRAAGPMDCRKG